MLGIVRDDAGATAAMIAQTVRNRPSELESGFSFSTYQAIARRAIEANRLARELQNDPTRIPRVSEVPGEIGMPMPGDRFMYSVVVRVSAPGSPPIEWRVDYTSETPMSFAQVAAEARSRIDRDLTPDRAKKKAYASVKDEAVVDVFLVGVGKR